jgi:hypothetical protein
LQNGANKQAWWYISTIPALGMLMQKDLHFEVILGLASKKEEGGNI